MDLGLGGPAPPCGLEGPGAAGGPDGLVMGAASCAWPPSAGFAALVNLTCLASDLPRVFRTADLWLIHAADCRSMNSSWACRGLRY